MLPSPLRRLATVGFVAFFFTLATNATFADAPLSRYFPKDNLVVYVEFEGLDAHDASWKKTARHA